MDFGSSNGIFSTVQRAKSDADKREKRGEKQKRPQKSASTRVFRVAFPGMYGRETESKILNQIQVAALAKETDEILAMTIASIKTLRGKKL